MRDDVTERSRWVSSAVQSSLVVYTVRTLVPLFFHRPQAQGSELFITSTLRENPALKTLFEKKSFLVFSITIVKTAYIEFDLNVFSFSLICPRPTVVSQLTRYSFFSHSGFTLKARFSTSVIIFF